MPEASVIRRMFEGVAPRYDFLNRLLSMGIDRGWRKRVVSLLELEPDHLVLDLCCGTGDLALALAPHARTVACDFTWNMLTRARAKSQGAKAPFAIASADALKLPFADDCFDRATVAFGVRNLEDLSAGLREIRRVLKPSGRLAVLEFSHPDRVWLRGPYRMYLRWLLPAIGALFSAKGDAYRYLAESIQGFPEPDVLVELFERAGFRDVRYVRLSFGIVAIHIGSK